MENGNMTPLINAEMCDGCGLNRHTQECDGNEFCDECSLIAQSLRRNPNTLARIARLTKLEAASATIFSAEAKKPHFGGLPEVLDAVRFRTRDCDKNKWYVSISEIEGQPVEIFASTAFDRDRHLQSRISNLTTITRLISLILRHVFLGEVLTLEKTLKQLHRSSRQQNDLPDMLMRVLSNYCAPAQSVDSKENTR
jgi:hypothetical protein